MAVASWLQTITILLIATAIRVLANPSAVGASSLSDCSMLEDIRTARILRKPEKLADRSTPRTPSLGNANALVDEVVPRGWRVHDELRSSLAAAFDPKTPADSLQQHAGIQVFRVLEYINGHRDRFASHSDLANFFRKADEFLRGRLMGHEWDKSSSWLDPSLGFDPDNGRGDYDPPLAGLLNPRNSKSYLPLFTNPRPE
ncbi:MAG: hypothetical protein HY537_03540 [Deltaproteobacteria bacterium]|nr:hypothetical protein [Deltaproteobacteria bacterium]